MRPPPLALSLLRTSSRRPGASSDWRLFLVVLGRLVGGFGSSGLRSVSVGLFLLFTSVCMSWRRLGVASERRPFLVVLGRLAHGSGSPRRRSASVVLLLLLTTACAPVHGPARPLSPIGAYDIAPTPRERVRDGGTLRLATTEFPTQWNYWHLGGADLDTARILGALMPWLFRSDQRGRVAADPSYLVRAEVTRRKPRQVVTYDLNPKARWSDGTPLGYRDFRALWRACRGRDGAYQITTSTGYDRIRQVARGVNDRQVVVTFDRPFGEWRSLFSPLYPAETIGDPSAWDRAWSDRLPVTAGPFRPEGIDHTAQAITIVRDTRWWGPRARLDRVVFRYLARDAMPGAFASGEIDAFDAGADAAAYRRARQVPGTGVRRAAGPDFSQLTFNGAAPALADANVRRAVAMAIDRRALARSALAGLDWPVRLLNDHAFVNTQEGYQDNTGDLGTYDPAAAGRLLDQAGRRTRGPTRLTNGRPLTLRYVYPASAATGRQSGELIQVMLGRVGVRVELRPVPDSDFFDRYLIPGAYDLAPFSWIGGPFPISNLGPIYGRPHGNDVRQNVARIGSAPIDTLLDRATEELNPAKARRYANEADRLIWNEVHSVTLYQRPQIVPTRQSLVNWGAFGLSTPAWPDVGFRR
ncbi:ABC transporter family substrate-binding protein [Actinoallomurus iriomotensis]|uniref:ABC transporter family substrate-binding protein n=1 Tax=Actinoallomurus iriomotensis TaxID=478107 RepID=UPI0025557E8C|nr:ABC transporter family substrate-binding protein [Actinoallomurus iriomotensis]